MTPILYTPMYIRQSITDPNGFIVRAERWNALWNLNIQQGDNNSQGIDNLTKGYNALRADYDNTVANTYSKTSVDNLLAAKENKTVTASHIKGVTFDKTTGVFTFTKEDGSFIAVDTALERVAIDVKLDPVTSELVLTLADGTEQRVSLASFIDTYTFKDSATVSWSALGKEYTPQIKPGSILMEHLGIPLQDTLTGYVNAAATSASAAEQSKIAAAGSATNASASAADAQVSKNAAALSEANAKGSETAAAGSKANAAVSAQAAQTSALNSEASAVRSEDAARRAETIVGGDFATNTKVDAIRDQKADAFTVQVTGNPIAYHSALRESLIALELSGFTKQSGTGDPSPTNIRPITGVGLYDKKIIFDGSADERWFIRGTGDKALFSIGALPESSGKVSMITSDFPNVDIYHENTVQGASNWSTAFYLRWQTLFTTVSELRAYLAAHPLTVYYQSTSYATATQVYCGLSITDANGYHGYAAGPMAPLYDGDTVDFVTGEVIRNSEKVEIPAVISQSHIYSKLFYLDNFMLPSPASATLGVCSHYNYGLYTQGKIGIIHGGRNVVYKPNGDYTIDQTGLNNFITYVTGQHTAGTPVTIVYQLATPTTETVPISEPITNAAGLVTVESENTLKVSFGGAASDKALRAHVTADTNPHGVTKAQVGLPNVDNTADTDKPVSTAQQLAIGNAANDVLTLAKTFIPNENLSDNSYLINPVNQRGSTSYSTDGYCVDRWALATGMVLNVANHTLTGSNASNNSLFYQRLLGLTLGQTYTLSLKVNGEIVKATHQLGTDPTEVWETFSWGRVAVYKDGGMSTILIYVNNGTAITVDWVKLELGTVATPYVPKGYGAELAECRRYYLKMDPVVKVYCNDAQYGQPRVSLSLGTVMRVTPTFTLTQGYKSSNLVSTSVDGTKTTVYLTLNPSAAGMLQSNCVVEASADLP